VDRIAGKLVDRRMDNIEVYNQQIGNKALDYIHLAQDRDK
jgi:hypothetical protein